MKSASGARIGRPPRKDYPFKAGILLTQETGDKLIRTAERFNMSISQVVRECVDTELPRLIQRLKKGTQRAKAKHQADLKDL